MSYLGWDFNLRLVDYEKSALLLHYLQNQTSYILNAVKTTHGRLDSAKWFSWVQEKIPCLVYFFAIKEEIM